MCWTIKPVKRLLNPQGKVNKLLRVLEVRFRNKYCIIWLTEINYSKFVRVSIYYRFGHKLTKINPSIRARKTDESRISNQSKSAISTPALYIIHVFRRHSDYVSMLTTAKFMHIIFGAYSRVVYRLIYVIRCCVCLTRQPIWWVR